MLKMIRFLLGILLVQIATVVLVLLAPELQGLKWLNLLIPLLVIGVFAAFWFSSMAKHRIKDEITAASAEHAKEKEKLQLNAERAKTRLVKKTQQQIARESKITHSKANFKVGAAFAGTIALGGLMVITELLTLGLLTMSTAGGALGGYLFRAKKDFASLIEDKKLGNKKLESEKLENNSKKPIKVIDQAKSG